MLVKKLYCHSGVDMKKLIKIFIYLIITFVVVIALAIGGIVMFINPNQFKPQITELVQKNANVVLNIDGDIEWTFYPWLGIKVQNISIASPNTPTVPLAKIQLAQASILLNSLLNKELNISDVVVNGLSVSLLKDVNGNTNWSFEKAEQAATTNGQKIEDKPSANTAQGSANIYIKSISVNDASLVYKDAQNNQAIALKNLYVNTGEVRPNQPIDASIKSGYALYDPKIEGAVDLSATIDFDAGKEYLQIKDLKLNNNVTLDNIHLVTDLTGKVDFDLKAQLLQVSNLSINNNGKLGDIALKDLQFKGLVKADLQKEIINFDQMQVVMNDLQVTGNLIAENYGSDNLKFVSELNTNTFNAKSLLRQLNVELPQMESKTALDKVSAKFSIHGNLKNIDINPININLDSTKITGSGAIALSKVPTIALVLKGDQLVINHYLPPKQASSQAEQNKVQNHPSTKSPVNPEIIPVLPDDLNIIADIQWSTLIFDQLNLNDNLLKASLKNGDLIVDHIQTKIYDGTISLSGSLKGKKEPKITINGGLQHIDLTKILPQFSLKEYISSDFLLSRLNQNHKDITVQGVLNSQFSMTSSGRKQNQVIANLNGNATFDLQQGRVNNLNYEKLMCQGIALLNQKQITGKFDRTFTDFQKLSGKISIRNGVVTNDPFQMIIPGVALNGKGDVNLNRMTIDYRMNAILTGDDSINSDPACQINQRFKGLPIPLICEGSLEQTDGLCRLDTEQLGQVALNLAKDAAKDKVKKELDKEKDKLQNKLDSEIEKQINKNPAIKGLLKNLL